MRERSESFHFQGGLPYEVGGNFLGEAHTPLHTMVQGKALVGTRWQSSQKLPGFSTLKSLTFD